MSQAMTVCPTCGERMSAHALPRHISANHKPSKSKPVTTKKGA